LLSTVSLAVDQSDVDGFTGSIGVGLMSFDLKEFNRQDEKLVQESGWLPGIDAAVSAEMNPLQARIRASYYSGDVDYDGQTQSGAAIDSSSDQKIWDISVLTAYRLPFLTTPRASLYAGGGYRHWQRDIQSVGSISGLDETYRWWSAQTGLNLEWRHGANLWVLDGRLTRTLDPRVDVDFHHTFDSANLDLGERWGWITEMAWRHRLSPRLSTGIRGFYESWDLGKSGLETLTAARVPAGNVFQPRIENRNYGFIVDLRHHW
ncbi:MAG: hypothetical protein ABF297_02095, partial [Thiogranum sp.]